MALLDQSFLGAIVSATNGSFEFDAQPETVKDISIKNKTNFDFIIYMLYISWLKF